MSNAEASNAATSSGGLDARVSTAIDAIHSLERIEPDRLGLFQVSTCKNQYLGETKNIAWQFGGCNFAESETWVGFDAFLSAVRPKYNR